MATGGALKIRPDRSARQELLGGLWFDEETHQELIDEDAEAWRAISTILLTILTLGLIAGIVVVILGT